MLPELVFLKLMRIDALQRDAVRRENPYGVSTILPVWGCSTEKQYRESTCGERTSAERICADESSRRRIAKNSKKQNRRIDRMEGNHCWEARVKEEYHQKKIIKKKRQTVRALVFPYRLRYQSNRL